MDLDKLKRSRRTVRQSTTKLINKLETESKKDVEMSIDIIEELLAQLIAKEASLYELDAEIIKMCTIEMIEDEVNNKESYNENIVTWKVRANRLITRHNTAETQRGTTFSKAEGSRFETRSAQGTIKLPRLELSKYNGNILIFNEFWQQFKTAIHDNKSLSDVERFSYLRSHVTQDAELAIRGLSLTGENYQTAIDILHERFGRKQLIIDSHMSNLLNLLPVRKSNDTHALRHLYSECEIQIRGLQNLGIETNSYSCLLYPILLKAIPNDLRMEFSRRSHDKQETKISDLLEFLKIEIECLERTENLIQRMDESSVKKNTYVRNSHDNGDDKIYAFKNKYSKPDGTKNQAHFNPKIPSAVSFHTSTMKQSEECIFCEKENSDHKSENCPLSVSDRKNKLIKQARCFRCLRKGHRIIECFKKNVCLCGRKHHKFICDRSIVTQKKPDHSKNESMESAPENAKSFQDSSASVINNCAQVSDLKTSVFLQTLKAEIINGDVIKPVRILLDVGSTKSFCLNQKANELGLVAISQEQMKVFSFGETSPKLETKNKVRIKLRNPINHDQTFNLEAILTDVITSAQVPIPCTGIKEFCKQRGIRLSEGCDDNRNTKDISLLIGSDYIWEFYTGKILRFSKNLVAVETRFGYCLSGTQNFYDKDMIAMQNATKEEFVQDMITMHIASHEESVSDNHMSEQIKKFWEIDILGIQDNIAELSKTDTEMMKEFEREIKFKNSRYEVKLPWNSNAEKLSNNFGIAKKRLVNLISRFKFDKKFFEDYNRIIEDQVSDGIVEEISNLNLPEIGEASDKVYFMPHHGVVRQDKSTTKLRIVYDCSAHEKNFASLNQCLHPGPNLNPNLLTILLKFRTHKVAFISDIEKAFLMVSVAIEDRDCQRFLWFEDPFEDDVKLKVLRTTRVTFGNCSSPFMLAATIKHHIKGYQEVFPEAFSMLNDNLYVDDLISGMQNVEEACLLSKQSKDIMEKASMKLRKWKTNSEELENFWKRENFDIGDGESHHSPLKVLGIKWNSKEDEFKLELSTVLRLLENQSYTKRKVLQTTCTIFDPIGFISPFLIRMKILFQKLWERGLTWDEVLPTDLQKEWNKWCAEVPDLQKLTIPRTYYPSDFEVSADDTELHIFCDASESAYGAVAYLRFTSNKRELHVSFVTSKARVTPLKRLTLPRLELMGAVIAARLSNYLQPIFGIDMRNQFFWSDSTIALSWIRGHASDWKPFVSNRVVEIQRLTDPQRWNHCCGRDNSSDYLTRGCSAEKLLTEEKWWKGPKWLAEDKVYWPKLKLNPLPKEVPENEKRDATKESIQLMCKTELAEPLFDIKKYSNLHKVLRVTAWILRFIHNARHNDSKKSKSLLAEELNLSESYWIKRIQNETFANELHALSNKRDIPSTSKICQFNPFMDEEGTLRVGGRLQNANLKFTEAHPIIMPSDSYFTELLITRSHLSVGHGGVAETLTQLRDKFWIPKGRQRVKSLINRCLICRRFKVKPACQDMAPLPPDRIGETFPFEVCGVDFAGPLFTKEGEKAYIALFTCAVTRAVHLETVSNLSTEKFMLAFRRFISRRGICRKIYSDNAKTFKKADKDLQMIYKLIEDPEVLDFLGKQGIQWRYIVERAAWWGGFWERMVRSTKTCLKKIILKASLKFEELETILTEVEAILNSRPLTYVYSEDKEPEPLTPGHFLIGRRLTSLPNKTSKTTTSTREILTRRYKYKLTLVDRFWREWKWHYLLELRSAHEIRRSKCPSNLQKDDVVFIHDSNIPRLMWKMGVIAETHPGRDGKVRSCTIKLSNGTFLKRPVQLLFPLELS